jgi:hypothetical protein
MEATPKSILIGILIFIFVITGGIVFLNGFFNSSPTYGVPGDDAKFTSFKSQVSPLQNFTIPQIQLVSLNGKPAQTCTNVTAWNCTGSSQAACSQFEVVNKLPLQGASTVCLRANVLFWDVYETCTAASVTQACVTDSDWGPTGMFNWFKPIANILFVILNILMAIFGGLLYIFIAASMITTIFGIIGSFFGVPTWFVGTLVAIVTLIGIYYLLSFFFKEK